MGSSKLKSSRLLILLTGMVVLLPLLAALQYYWLGQVSQAASERLQSSLRASATGFRRDFNREFIRAYLNFQMDSFAQPDDIERHHLERFEHWNQTAPYARLISDVYVVNYDEADRPLLRHLNTQAKQFDPIEWSDALPSMRDQFAQRYMRVPSPDGRAAQPLESFTEELPGLVVPFPTSSTEKPTSQARTVEKIGANGDSPPFPPGFTIVKFDLSYLQREFIPALRQRHFFDGSQTEYDLVIRSLDQPEKVIYSSREPAFAAASSDASTRIFGLEADELEAFVKTEGGAGTMETHPPGQPLRLIKLSVMRRPPIRVTTPANESDGRWQLLIQHQMGSLTAAVNTTRRRNLAISFGILMLLGAGILMTAISTRRAERLARQQLNFVAGVSHELRTPLAVICSAGENLAHGIVDTPEKAAQYGQVIYREGRRLTDMVEQVLEFASARSGQQRYELRPTDVADVIEEAKAACQTQIQQSDFIVETSIASQVPAIQGDRAALRRAVQNLISNAIKYGNNDGTSRWARISVLTASGKNGEEVQISVEDRGLGIDSADLPHVFEPFYRGRQAMVAQIEGSGVGLSLVKQIVEAHGGRVSVKSTLGSGSIFALHLPIAVQTRDTNGDVKEVGRL